MTHYQDYVGCDYLFLLEITVKNVHYSYSCIDLDKNELSALLETCICVNFLHFPTMEIRQDTNVSCLNYNSSEVNIGDGKSCLFAMNTNILNSSHCFNTVFNVVRMCPGGCPAFVCIGKAVTDLSKIFNALMNSSCDIFPATKCVSDELPMVDCKCRTVGCISVLIRLSCFGSHITTQFMLGFDNYVFKSGELKEHSGLFPDCFDDESKNYIDTNINNNIAVKPGFDSYNNFMNIMQTQQVQMPQYVTPSQMPNAHLYYPQTYHLFPPQTDQTTLNFTDYNGEKYQLGKPWPDGGGPSKMNNDGWKMENDCEKKLTSIQPSSKDNSTPKCCSLNKNHGSELPSPIEYPFCQRVTIGEVDNEKEDDEYLKAKSNCCDCPCPTILDNPCTSSKAKKKKKPSCPLEMKTGDYCLRPDCSCGLPMVPWMKKQNDKSNN